LLLLILFYFLFYLYMFCYWILCLNFFLMCKCWSWFLCSKLYLFLFVMFLFHSLKARCLKFLCLYSTPLMAPCFYFVFLQYYFSSSFPSCFIDTFHHLHFPFSISFAFNILCLFILSCFLMFKFLNSSLYFCLFLLFYFYNVNCWWRTCKKIGLSRFYGSLSWTSKKYIAHSFEYFDVQASNSCFITPSLINNVN